MNGKEMQKAGVSYPTLNIKKWIIIDNKLLTKR